MERTIDGPRVAPAAGGAARSLVVFLHGYGADGNDLIELGRVWSQALPHTAFVAPNAPEPCGMAPVGRQWFALTFRDPSEYWRGVGTASPGLDRFLDAELARHGLDNSRLALVGFSQGTMLALHAGLRRPRAPAAIVGFSGLLAGPEHLGETTGRPRILLVHGDADDVIPVGMLSLAVNALGEAGIAAQFHISRGVGHGIDEDGLALGAVFLRDALR